MRSFLLFLLHESIKSYWVHDVLSDCCFFSGGESFSPLTNEFFPSISSVSVYFSSFMIALNPTGSMMSYLISSFSLVRNLTNVFFPSISWKAMGRFFWVPRFNFNSLFIKYIYFKIIKKFKNNYSKKKLNGLEWDVGGQI